MVGSGTTTVWFGVMFVPNPLLLFYTGHMRTQHTKEKPFVCDVDGCGYKTGDSGNLARKWYVCGCGCGWEAFKKVVFAVVDSR